MSLNWTSGDSSSQTTSPVAGPSHTERNARPELDGLHAINDFDFETLIEILGTSGVDKHSDSFNALKIQPHEVLSLKADDNISMSATSPDLNHVQAVGDGDANALPAEPQVRAAPRSPRLVGSDGPVTPISPLDLPPTDSISPIQQDVQRSPPQKHETRNQSAPSRDENREPALGTDFTAASGFTRLNEELGVAVSGAKEQVMDLRNRIQALKDEVKGLAPHLYHRAFDNPRIDSDLVKQLHPSDGQSDGSKDHNKLRDPVVLPSQVEVKSPSVAVQNTVAGLSDREARTSLVNICEALHVDPSMFAARPQTAVAELSICNPPNSLNDVVRALRLVSDMDELVWRRPRRNGRDSPRDMHNIYGEENIRSLMDHVRLWERAARSRASR